jgi:hypothetical protein
LVVKNGMNSFSRTSCEMPAPFFHNRIGALAVLRDLVEIA